VQRGRDDQPTPALPSHLRELEVFGVRYIHGSTPDGGKLWVVGNVPALYDFFLPERWRRTPRTKLSATHETYRTRSRDEIHLLYRRSEIGGLPSVDPFSEGGKRIREHGYNSPFEEIAIAERLRQLGIRTTHPRAVYRTAHRTTKVERLRDERRFESHARLDGGDRAHAILEPGYDYYTLWGYFRGVDLDEDRNVDILDLSAARAFGCLDDREADELLARVERNHETKCCLPETFDPSQYVLVLGPNGQVLRDAAGAPRITTSMNLTGAYDCGLLGERECRGALDRTHQRLREASFEKLHRAGKDFLLTLTGDGEPVMDERDELRLTLCNFSLVRWDNPPRL
jgi:hypothetical protein